MDNLQDKFQKFDDLSSSIRSQIEKAKSGISKLEQLLKKYDDLSLDISNTYDKAISDIKNLCNHEK